MHKGAVVTDAIAVVGLIAIGGLMFAQVPGMMEDIKETISQESVRSQAVEIADLITLVNAASEDVEIKIIHKLPPEGSYSVTVANGYVTVEAGGHKAVAKTLSKLAFGSDIVRELEITKDEIKKVG